MDQYEKKLQDRLEELKKCQKNKNIKDCLKCSEVLECIIRKNYVDSVYESMNKGQGGGFEF